MKLNRIKKCDLISGGGHGGFERLVPGSVFLSASNFWIRMQVLSCFCGHALARHHQLSETAKPQIKPFILEVALVMVSYHSNRKVTKTNGERQEMWKIG